MTVPIYQSLMSKVIRDIRFQVILMNVTFNFHLFSFFSPTNSLLGYITTLLQSRATKPLYSALIRHLDIKPDQSVFEIGFGRGVGLEIALDKVFDGEGHIFGTELSQYALESAVNRIGNDLLNKRFTVIRTGIYNHLPFPSNWFHGIFHVDIFYAWNKQNILEICAELYRVLKPGCTIICGMELNRLHRLTICKILRRIDYDMMRYIHGLESNGFEDIQILYEVIDRHGNVCDASKRDSREIQLISARKPPDISEMYAEELLKKLEREIKEIEEDEKLKTLKIEGGSEKSNIISTKEE